MGSDIHVVVWSRSRADRLADLAVHRVDLLEQCWSRFRSDSELNRLNARAGDGPVTVSEDLHRLVATLVTAWQWTEGDVDATVLGAMVAMGYDRTFADVISSPLPSHWSGQPGVGMSGVALGPGHVSLPRGVGLDPGAVGKGLAGDIVTTEISHAGADAVLVSIGGDVVTIGTPPDSGGWRVSLRDDRTPSRDEIDILMLAGKHRAVATSSTLRRRWSGRHHVIDPRTGLPASSEIVQATVVADSGWRAEAGATLALLRGGARADWLEQRGCTPHLLDRAAAHA
jgi:thiamine biosynthesis lipoprotein